ncbi:MAG: hypothetical protein HKN87_02500 [Saprospiraceae bacterium]|nr:hypothetical protein [Saprospiraceae bacterium]
MRQNNIATMMCGLVMFGYLDNLTGSMRNSIIALAICFAVGDIGLFHTQRQAIKEIVTTCIDEFSVLCGKSQLQYSESRCP